MYSTLYFKCVIFTKPDTAAFEKDIRILPKVNKVFGILKKKIIQHRCMRIIKDYRLHRKRPGF